MAGRRAHALPPKLQPCEGAHRPFPGAGCCAASLQGLAVATVPWACCRACSVVARTCLLLSSRQALSGWE